MKLNKTLINKILKQDGMYVRGDSFAYEFICDTFTLTLNRSHVDALTSAVHAIAVDEAVAIVNVEGRSVSKPLGLERYLRFASKDRARPILGSINFTDSKIQATDSYRLIEGVNYSEIIGLYDAFALELLGLIDTPNGYQDEQGKLFFGGLLPQDRTLKIKPVNGEFPNVAKLFVEGDSETLVIGRVPRSIVNRNSHLGSEILATFHDNKILVTSNHADPGVRELVASIPCTVVVGCNNDGIDDGWRDNVTFNWKYLKDLFTSLGTDTFEVTYVDVLKPLQFANSDGMKALLMPIRSDFSIVDVDGSEIIRAGSANKVIRENVYA